MINSQKQIDNGGQGWFNSCMDNQIDSTGEPPFLDNAVLPVSPPVGEPHIYFIQAGKDGPIKIGIALNVRQRLNTLQVASAEKLTLLYSQPGIPALEKAFHREWAEHHLRGEWFKPARDILIYISRKQYRRGHPLHAHAMKMKVSPLSSLTDGVGT